MTFFEGLFIGLCAGLCLGYWLGMEIVISLLKLNRREKLESALK